MNTIKSISYVKATLVLNSPMAIASGYDDVADISVTRDFGGIPFIPGSSIAGALRASLESSNTLSNLAEPLFGFTKKKDSITVSRQSNLYVYDAYPITNANTQVRDMVKLCPHTKTAVSNAKFDAETIDADTQFLLRLEFVQYDGEKTDLKDPLYALLAALRDGGIRLGGKKNRGFGNISIQDIQIEDLILLDGGRPVATSVNRWINFNWDSLITNVDIDSILPVSSADAGRVWEIPFSIPGGVMVRSYEEFQEIDAAMFSSNQGYLIPGSSIAGCVRHACFNILYYDLGLDNAEDHINEMFGFVNETNRTAKASAIGFSDALLTGGTTQSYSRNKVDRFTGGVVDKALFTEKLLFNSKGKLEIRLGARVEGWMKALLLMALQDVARGIQPLGGECSVGRGLLEIAADVLPPLDPSWQEELRKRVVRNTNIGGTDE